MPHEGPPQTPQMPHQMTPQASPYRPMTPPTPTSAQPQVPRPQAVLGTIQQSYSGGYITGARAQQGYAVQSVPVPIPHAVNKPDSYSQSPATPRVSAQQPLAPAMGTAIAAPAAVNYPVPSRAFQGDSRSLAARGYAIPAPRTGGMLRTLLALLISVTLFITGYYIITQVWKPAISLPQNISTPRLSFGEKPATIKNVQLSSITDTGAIVTWETDKPTSAQVIVCDPSGFCTWTELQAPLVTKHWVPLHNLKASTTYHLTLLSKDANGKEASLEKELTTLAQSDTTPPILTEVSASKIEETSVTITWATNEPATSQVEYGLSETYGKTSPLDNQMTTSHSVILTGLEPNTLYHFKVKSTDASGNEATSLDNTLRTQASLPVGPKIGNRAPDFTLKTINGEEISLKSLRGKKVVLNFWATWCSPCVGEMPYFQDITRTWKEDELVVLAVNLEENISTVRNFLAGERFTFTILLDIEGAVGSRYDVSSIPRTFFIDREGIIRETKQGSFPNLAAIEELIRSL